MSTTIATGFSYASPPPNKKTALERLDKLDKEITNIENQLKDKQPNGFPSEDDYHLWRMKAESARSHKEREFLYLREWIDVSANADNPLLLQSSNRDILEQADRLASEIVYKAKYSQDHLPENINASMERIHELAQIKNQLQLAFSQINALCVRYKTAKKDMSGLKKPLQDILSLIEMELAVLRAFNRQNSSFPSSNWKVIILNLLERVQIEGFELTDEEQEILDVFKKQM